MIEHTHWTKDGYKTFSESLRAANNIIRRKIAARGQEKIKSQGEKSDTLGFPVRIDLEETKKNQSL